MEMQNIKTMGNNTINEKMTMKGKMTMKRSGRETQYGKTIEGKRRDADILIKEEG